jgi:hypothetical protein
MGIKRVYKVFERGLDDEEVDDPDVGRAGTKEVLRCFSLPPVLDPEEH